MVSALDSESSGPVFEPWPGALWCVLGKDTQLSQCLSPPRCKKWVPANVMLGVTLLWTSIPSGGVNILLVASGY